MTVATQNKRIILFKKLDKIDSYNELLLKNNYSPEFIPVLDHKTNNIDVIKNILLQGPQQAHFNGLILTSQRSVQAMKEALNELIELSQQVMDEWHHIPIYIVGPQTAQALHQLPLFSTIVTTDHWIISPIAAELIGPLIKDHQRRRLPGDKLLFLAGDKRRDLIPIELKAEKCEFEEIQSYVTCAHPDLSNTAFPWLSSPTDSCWVVYFSPSGLQFLLSSIDTETKEKLLAASVQKTIRIAAIGPTTAEAITQVFNIKPDVMAEKPDAQHLIHAIVQFDTIT